MAKARNIHEARRRNLMRLNALERENNELRKANKMLRTPDPANKGDFGD
jgi:hypothetical protein